MTDPQARFEQLIQHLRDLTGLDFPVKNNSCTLVDNSDQEKVVLELPEQSDLLLLHRMMTKLPTDPEIRNGRALQLLALNSQPAKLLGAWFCIDPEANGIHLMLGQPVGNLSDGNFENLIFNFVDLADDLAKEMLEEEAMLIPNPNLQDPGKLV